MINNDKTQLPFYFLFQPLSQAYHDLALAYATNSPDEVRAVLNKHNEIFVRVSVLCNLFFYYISLILITGDRCNLY